MLIAFISWWYKKGWAWKAERVLDGLERSVDTFSLGLLVKTWFAPFRQIDAGRLQNAPLDVRVRKFFDRLVSRFIGAFLRSIVMVIGIFYIAGKAIFGVIELVLWLALPILPLIFAGLFLADFTPQILPQIQRNLPKIKLTNPIKRSVKNEL